VQRCRRHKQENVLGHLPEAERPWVKRKLREAWALDEADLAERRLVELARALEPKRPGAAASVREGLTEALTITRLGLSTQRALGRTLASTNPIKSMLSICRERARNVKRWRGGEMALRWTAAGMLDSERSFRRVKGFRELPKLQAALRHHAADVDQKEVRDFPIAA
jgi:putative transposase